MKKVRAKRRFKGVVGLVIRNLSWLDINMGATPEIGEDMAKNIEALTRYHKDNKITIEDVAKLNIPPENRSEKDKRHLRGLFDVMKFFRKYPKV